MIATARTLADVERLEPLWSRVAWGGEQAEHAYFLAAARSGTWEPFAAFVDGGEAALAGRVEARRLETRIGYLRVYAPRVRILQIVPGGIVAADAATAAQLRGAVADVLTHGGVDAVALPAIPVDSDVHRAFAALGGPLERQRFVPTWTRRVLELPPSFEEFLRSRSRKIRFGIRYDGKRLEEALGDSLAVRIHRDASELERLAGDLERVASASYQRAVGAGFVDDEERRELLRLSLERGWTRAFLLEVEDAPVAYWLCSTYRGTITLRSTGYVPEHARLRPGIYLLMRVIEDACADPTLHTLDFGPGRSAYKRHFSSGGYEEQNLTIFAPLLRPRVVNVTRTLVLGAGAGARRVLDAAGGTERLKAAWRRRLRR